jgi:hypothetical protein
VKFSSNHAAAHVVSAVRISDIYQALTGVTPKRIGRDRYRGPAPWRDGNGLNVAMDDSKNVFHDFVDDSGGGVLDLVVRVQGGSRADALRWVADCAGISVDDRPLSSADRQRWARERAQVELIRAEAAYFADAAALMADWALDGLSSEDPERAVHTAILARLRISAEAEYRAWLEHKPTWAAALVQAGRERSRRLQIALARWIVAGMPGVRCGLTQSSLKRSISCGGRALNRHKRRRVRLLLGVSPISNRGPLTGFGLGASRVAR